MRSRVSRSAKALLAAVVLGCAAGGAAQAQSVYGGLRIDLSAIPDGAFQTKRQLQACLGRALPEALAGRISPGARGAPLLVVRPRTVWLANVAATDIREEFGGGTGTTSLDSLEGDAIVGGTRIPVTVSANPDFGTQGLPEYNAQVRTETLCRTFAYWVARRV
jgi:hypothetical protein